MIPVEAVEAVAKTIYEFLEDTPWEQSANFRDDVWFKEAARRGLESAAPHILAEAWHLAYWQGITDERRGLDSLECGPSRANPYRSKQ